MKQNITLQLDVANKTRIESIEQMKDSIFRDAYAKAFRMIHEVLKENEEYEKTENDITRKRNYGQIYNVIAFLGNRGIGKTSVMLSLEAALEKGRTESEICVLESMLSKTIGEMFKNRFSTLDYIDVTLLGKKEGVLDFILARMWDRVEEGFFAPRKSHEEEALAADLSKQFIQVRNSHIAFQKGPSDEAGKMNSSASLRALHNLAASKNLHDDFQELVRKYLEYLDYCAGKKSGSSFLVISIDDVDVGTKNAYEILEEIRRFLTIPRMLVLLTADLERLNRICAERIANGMKFETDELNRISNDYLAKALPQNKRIYLPGLRDAKILSSTEYQLEPVLESEKNITNPDKLSEKDMILKYMAKYFGLFFDGTRGRRHFLQNFSLRSLVNYFISMKDVIENSENNPEDISVYTEEKLNWFKEDIRHRLSEELLNDDQKRQFQQLLYVEPKYINERIVEFIDHELNKIDALKANGYYQGSLSRSEGYNKVLEGCRLLESCGDQYRPVVDCIIALYTLLMSAGMSRNSDDIIKEMRPSPLTYGAWDIEWLFGDVMWLKGPVFQNLPLILTIPWELTNPEGREFTPREAVELVAKILEENKDRILAFEIYMLMFHDPSSEISLNEIPFTINKTNTEGTEEIKGIGGMKQPLDQSYMSVKLQFSALTNYSYGFLNMVYNLYIVNEESIKMWPHLLAKKLYEQIPKKKRRQIKNENTEMYLKNSVEKCIKKHFLHGQILRWKEKYSDDGLLAAIPFQNVEAMYTIEKELKKDYPRNKEKPQSYYAEVSRYFDYIGLELKKRDKYYENLGVRTRYEEKFSECPCVSVFREEWESGVNRMFEEIFRRTEEAASRSDKRDTEV